MIADAFSPDLAYAQNSVDVDTLKWDELRKELRYKYKKWSKLHKDMDPNGSVWQRMSNTIHRRTTSNKIDALLSSIQLDRKKVNLSLDLLRQKTNRVRHSGRLPYGSIGRADSELLSSSRLGLRLVLLKLLGYSGSVIDHDETGWKINTAIEEYFQASKDAEGSASNKGYYGFSVSKGHNPLQAPFSLA